MLTLITSRTCTRCRAVKRVLNSKGIDFIEVDVSNLSEQEISDYNVQSLPVLIKDDNTVLHDNDAITYVRNL